jgi:hypothetical protein
LPGPAEAEIIANNQMLELKRMKQHIIDELRRGKSGKCRIEAADHRLLDAGLGQQLKLFAQGGQACRR